MLSYMIWLLWSACKESDIQDNKIMEGGEIGDCLDGLDNDCNGYLETDDQDNDGLMDWHEWTLGSDAFNPDSDQDSRLDGDEVSQFGEELVPFDTDGDGIFDIFDTDDDEDGIATFPKIS